MTTKPMLSLAAVLLATACGARAKGVDRPDPHPAALAALETMSEHAYERALAGDAAAVVDSSDQMLDAWTRLRGDAHRRGASGDVLTEIDQAVLALGDVARSSTDKVVLARAANRISGSMDDLFVLYGSEVSADVMEIDYLGRELALDGIAVDLRRAGTHQSLLDSRWIELRLAVEGAGHDDELGRLEAAVKATRDAVASRDSETITTTANILVDRVDDIASVLD